MAPWMTTIITALISSFISVALTGIVIGVIVFKWQRKEDQKVDKEVKQAEEREKALSDYNTLMLKGIIASLSLGEATAEAVETQKYNGKQKDARKYAEDVKHEIQDFMYSQGAKHLNK